MIFILTLAASIAVHAIIWLAAGFMIGLYPAWSDLVYSPGNPFLYPPAVWAGLVLFLFATFLVVRMLIRTTEADHPAFGFLHQGRGYWSALVMVKMTTDLFISLIMPVVVFLMGPMTPPVVEIANLLTIYVLGSIAFSLRFSTRQYTVQLSWLAGVTCACTAFIMTVNAQQSGVALADLDWSIFTSRAFALAITISIVAHLVFWSGICFLGADRTGTDIFARAKQWALMPSGWPQKKALAVCAMVLGGYGWILFFGGADFFLPVEVAGLITDEGYLARFGLWFVVAFLTNMVMLPAIFRIARNSAPVIIGISNIAAMFMVTTLTAEGIHLSWPLGLSVVAIAATTIGFMKAKEAHTARQTARAAQAT